MKLNNIIDAFIAEVNEMEIILQGLVVYKDNKKIVSYAPAPFSVYDKKQVYSLSKSFCSTAVGVLCDRGILDPSEKITDIFPDEAPQKTDEKLSAMTLSHVLSMNTGHSSCVMNEMVNSDNPVKAFMEHTPEFYPGTHFAYNTGASFLASACVTKRTGVTAHDVLEKYVFPHLGIENTMWVSYKGISEGGVGIHISCEDAAKLGLLYLNKGKWGDKQILSEKYVDMASAAVSDNSGNGNPDWCAGYGFQFWRNYRGGYRGDGAYGQAVLIHPDENVVISLFSEGSNYQGLFDSAYKMLNRIKSVQDMHMTAQPAFSFVPLKSDNSKFGYYGVKYELQDNKSGFKFLKVRKTESGFELLIDSNTISIRDGVWTEGVLKGKNVKPNIPALTSCHDMPYEYYASGAVSKDSIKILLYGRNCPNCSELTVDFSHSGLILERKGYYAKNCDLKIRGHML